MTNKLLKKPDFTISSFSEEETRINAKNLGKKIQKGDLIFLFGELGAGKTRFTQGLTMGINSPQIARSPTFVLITEYTGDIILHHCDLYRINAPEEVIDLELEELLDKGALVVEWPEKGGVYMPDPDLIISLEIKKNNSRKLLFFSYSDRGNNLIQHIKENL
tara:strand:- start:129 stop:614 length:486 start_codon:yes stop_codon:yes gene_type:complete